MTTLAWRPEWQSLLANGTVNNPAANNLTGIVYGAFSPPSPILNHIASGSVFSSSYLRSSIRTGDYYFVKNANDLVSLGIATCNSTLTGSTPSSPSASAPGSAPSASSTDGVRASSGVLKSLEMTRISGLAVALAVVGGLVL